MDTIKIYKYYQPLTKNALVAANVIQHALPVALCNMLKLQIFFQAALHPVQCPKTTSDFTAWGSAPLPRGPDWCWMPKGSSKDISRSFIILCYNIPHTLSWKSLKCAFVKLKPVISGSDMTSSILTWKTNLTGSLRRIPLVLSQHWRHLLVRWCMSLLSRVNTWMKFTLRRSCFLPAHLVKLNRRWCWSIFPRYLIITPASKSWVFIL